MATKGKNMQFNVVFIDADDNKSTFPCTCRRLPTTVDALINVLDANGHNDLIERIENQAKSHTLVAGSPYEDLRSDVDAEDFDYSISHKLEDGNEDDMFENLEDGDTLYLQEAPDPTADEEVSGDDDDAGDDTDVTLLSIIVKVHGGDKRTVHVPEGATVQDVLDKSGVRVPAGSSFAFNGNDVRATDRVGAGGMLSIAGKVTGG